MTNKFDNWSRLKKVIIRFEKTINGFAMQIGLQRAENLYHIRKGNYGISQDLADRIIKCDPEIDRTWLLSGVGNMLKSDGVQQEQIPFYIDEVESIITNLDSVEPAGYMTLPYKTNSDIVVRSFSKPMSDTISAAQDLFLKRNYLLDQMFLATPTEVARLEDINQCLRELTKQLEDKISTLYRRDLSYGYEQDWSDEYEGYLVWQSDCNAYEGDDIYGSDIQRMLSIQQGIYNDRDCLGACVHIFKRPKPTDNPSMSDKELEVINKLDDEIDDWKEGRWSRIPAFAHIKVCYAMHHMFDHQNLSIVDILHLCEYRLELERRLCHYTDSHGQSK